MWLNESMSKRSNGDKSSTKYSLQSSSNIIDFLFSIVCKIISDLSIYDSTVGDEMLNFAFLSRVCFPLLCNFMLNCGVFK